MSERAEHLDPLDPSNIHAIAGKLLQRISADQLDAEIVQTTADFVDQLRADAHWRSDMMAAFADSVGTTNPIAAATIRYVENLQDQMESNDRWNRAQLIAGLSVDNKLDPRLEELLRDRQ